MSELARLLRCDVCGKEVDAIAAKMYIAPILPGKSLVSYMANYSHSADMCQSCADRLTPKMKKRQPRQKKPTRTKAKIAAAEVKVRKVAKA